MASNLLGCLAVIGYYPVSNFNYVAKDKGLEDDSNIIERKRKPPSNGFRWRAELD